MIEPARIQALTFDCYGTLIDWESGILAGLRPLLARHAAQVEDERLLEMYGEAEAEAERGAYLPYREVLRRVVRRLGDLLAFSPTDAETDCLADSLPSRPPFEDTVESLRSLKKRFRLAIVSNIDDDLFARTARVLEVPFDAVVTAAQVRSYKPTTAHFHRVLERLGLSADQVLHVAQSLYHDIAPASRLGLATVWVNRRGRKRGPGATPPASAKSSLEVPDLRTLVTNLLQ